MGIIKSIFGSHSSRELKKITVIIDKIEALEEEYKQLTDDELRNKTDEFKERIEQGETLDSLLVEAFATVREAARRTIGEFAFRVQLIGGVVLHQGRIAEMKTGEGKTHTSLFPVYLNALAGKGAHVVTVNEYLAKFQSEWMGRVHRFLGLSVGLVMHDSSQEERREAYACDVTYGTNNEMGFDYLRDNMVVQKSQMAQRGHFYAIVDEVDSILIDEARTPLVISGMGDKSTDMYILANRFVKSLKMTKVLELNAKEEQDDIEGDYVVDEKAKSCTLTASGIQKAEQYFNVENLSDYENVTIVHHVNQAIYAHGIKHKDIDYVEKDGEIIIVDDFTGRLMFGRRYSDGLHQAVEAKENVNVNNESETCATITFQNYFRMYNKLSGMTGTAVTEENEFRNIYNLDVVEIPTNRPMIRNDRDDVIYKTEAAKYNAVIEYIAECNEKGQPVLVGTVSVEKSERLSKLLSKKGIKHEVLNAKHHDREAEIVAQAGRFEAVTIATNMAGRGTDIILGGNPSALARTDMRKKNLPEEILYRLDDHSETTDEELIAAREEYFALVEKYKEKTIPEAEKVRNAGGLCIIGTERHESRRIDNQLRGRAGRQGDPGASRFYLAMEDDLMRIFGGERMSNMVTALKIPEDMPIEARIMSGSIENAQKRIEGDNFERRKHVLQYDEVMNQQREVIYGQRRKVLEGEDLKEFMQRMSDDVIEKAVRRFTLGDIAEEWDIIGLREYFTPHFLNEKDLKTDDINGLNREGITELLKAKAEISYKKQEEVFGEFMREAERAVLLKIVDTKWKDHIDNMEQLKSGVGLRAYGQRDPVVEYKIEGSDMFDEMIEAVKEDTVKTLFLIRPKGQKVIERVQVIKAGETPNEDGSGKKPVVKRQSEKTGPNDPCPCGSGKKYKKCCKQ